MPSISFEPPDRIEEGGRVTLIAFVPQDVERIRWWVEAGEVAEPTQETSSDTKTDGDGHLLYTTWDTTGLRAGKYTISYKLEGGERDRAKLSAKYEVVPSARSRRLIQRGTDAGRRAWAWLTPARLAAIAALGFGVAAAWWFIATAKRDGDLAIGNAFAGLGYLSAALVVAVLVVGLGWLANMWRSTGTGQTPTRRPRRSGGDDRGIVRAQLAWGAGLIIVGAVVGLICLCFVHPSDTIAGPSLALATATIGAGATLLPAGAASAASARIQQAANGGAPDPVVVTTIATREQFKGTVVPNGTASSAYFEYQDAPEPSKGEAPIAKTGPAQSIAASVAVKEVELKPTTLESAKHYRVRLVAETAAGRRIEGNWLDVA
jgi:hypothetical protein